jgi:putative GTP pyrophosphokinase
MTNIDDQYRRLLPSLEKLDHEVLHQLESILVRSRVTLANPIEHRVKSLDSLIEKIQRNSLPKDAPLTGLPDLVGFRVVLVFRRDVPAVLNMIESTFEVLDSEDTAHRLSEVQFGYQSHHCICRIPQEWSTIPSISGLESMKFEIQLRTAAQHIWAAASHKLQYKVESSVPSPLRRSIHRVAALLETVDLEFERVLAERANFEERTPTRDANELNVVTLRKLLDRTWPKVNKKGDGEIYDELLVNLLEWGVTDVAQLEELLQKHKDTALAKDRKRGSHRFAHVGLTRVALASEFGDQWHNRKPPTDG